MGSKKADDNIRIKDLPQQERPRERLMRYGTSALSNAELLALIMRTGTKEENILSLSNRLLKEYDIRAISTANVSELQKVCGVGEAKSCQLVACFELSRRLASYQHDPKPFIRSAADAAKIFMESLRGAKKECLCLVLLDSKNRLISSPTVSVGDINGSIANPREVFRAAITHSASRLFVVHNHPSGDPAPSEADIVLTEKLIEAGELLGINVLDHVIIGDGEWWSWRESA
ncbi:MAG: DNA repair protein RadC [Nanoarchaeota archaeon]|nr:DNA repair protein RadC [Nanoarchaeota archaeon]